MKAFKPLLLFGEGKTPQLISKSLKIDSPKARKEEEAATVFSQERATAPVMRREMIQRSNARGGGGRGSPSYEEKDSMSEDVRRMQERGWVQFKNKTFHFDTPEKSDPLRNSKNFLLQGRQKRILSNPYKMAQLPPMS